jgi:hypothetical protein
MQLHLYLSSLKIHWYCSSSLLERATELGKGCVTAVFKKEYTFWSSGATRFLLTFVWRWV